MDLKKLDQKELGVILAFTQSLVDQQRHTDDQVAFDIADVDEEGAEAQARRFIAEKRAGRTGKAEVQGDATIRKGVQEWMTRTRRVSRISK